MLACSSCGRAWNARVLDPASLSMATCPGCGGELLNRPPKTRIAGQPQRARFIPGTTATARMPLEQRLTGLGG
jgi:predicted RNA-binding Zn-ribbon protein involved in translation (DUF1610 family)